MRSFQTSCDAITGAAPDFVDITDQLGDAVRASGIRNGHVGVFSPHTKCSLIVNERESGLLNDVRTTIERIGGDRAASTLIGSNSLVLPAVDGTLRLGTWQRVMLVELDGPAQRSVVVQIIGE